MKIRIKKLMASILCTILLSLSLIPPYIPKVNAQEYPTYAVVNFKTKDCKINTHYTTDSGRAGYTNGCYGADAAFLGIENGKVKFKLSGSIGYVNPSEVEIRNMDPEVVTTYISNYVIENGEIKHVMQTDVNYYNSASVITLGPAPSGMKEGTYYSYDGIYFYPDNLDGFKMMIDDYKGGTNYRAINANNPYYNYYLYLPARTISNYISEDLKKDFSTYHSKMTSYPAKAGESHLYGEHLSFIEYQGEYGVNSMMSLGLAKNESGMGKSIIAYNKNNLFGMAAFDSNTGNALSFPTVKQGIRYFTKNVISEGYVDPLDYLNRFQGGHFGNKESGFNVKYASDPYWGEKEASYYYNFDKAYGMQDYQKYTVGIKGNNGNYNIKKEASTTSKSLYQTTKNKNIPFIILDTVQNSEGTWYKVQTDPTLLPGRNDLQRDNGAYDFNSNYGYIHSSIISYKSTGKDMKKRYTIDFNPNGGKFDDGEASTKKITVEEYTVPEVSNPSRDGYIFAGWNETVMPAQSNKTYTAVWKSMNPQKYNITFDANGGKFEDGSTTKTQSVEEGSKPNEPKAPTREGFTFVGWDSEISLVTGNKTYKAVWEKVLQKFDITFDANGGKFKNGQSKITVNTLEGQKPQISETPTREGYEFIGWDQEIIAASKNTTYKAVWQKIKEEYTITFDANGGSFSDGLSTYTVKTIEGEMPKQPQAPTKKGYKFSGWNPQIVASSKSTTYKAVWEKVKTYEIVFDADGGKFENGKDTLTVNVEENQKPTVNIPTKKGYIFQEWNPEITAATENTTYKAVWKELSLDDLEEKQGRFDLEYLKQQDGKLKIKGFSTIDGTSHKVNDQIDYYVMLENIDNGSETNMQPLTRITDKNDITYQTPSSDGIDYTYSWFEGNIDFQVPAGDYKIWIIAVKDGIYSKNIVNNQMFGEQVTTMNRDGKYLMTRNNYFDKDRRVELIIRDEEIGKKTTSALSNQYGQLEELKFNSNQQLYLYGNAFSSGSNLSANATVKRSIIFENTSNYKRTEYSLGSIVGRAENGQYEVKLPSPDHLDKSRAWYQKSIDISNLEQGRYAIYIQTDANVSDYGELNDQLFTDFSKVTANINGKKYSFEVNYNKRYRIELIVK